MTAPAPSPAEQAVIDRFGIFEPEERMVGVLVRAGVWPLAVAERAAAAVAAVAAYRAQDGGAEAAVRRVEALADELYDVARDYRHVPPGTDDAGARNAHMAIARRIRAALAPQAGDGAR